MNQKPQLTKSIKISNVGPFNEDGIQINFGAKQNPDKANIHILVGENGCGKSTVLKSIFVELCGFRVVKVRKQNGFKIFSLNKELLETRAFIYTPNEKNEDDIFYEGYQKNINTPFHSATPHTYNSISKLWIKNYAEQDYLEFIQNLKNVENAIKVGDIKDEDVKKRSINQSQIAIKIKNAIKQIYGFDFEYSFASPETKFNYRPTINGKIFEFSELSTGYRQIISLITDILIKVWSIESDLEDKSQGQFVLLLDEIDVHLHPKAQRRILPALQSMFPNSEIFCTTHSPFVVNSAIDAWVYELSEENYKNKKGELWQEGDGTKFLDGTKTNPFDGYETILLYDFNFEDKLNINTKKELAYLFDQMRQKKPNLEIISPIIKRIRESKNEGLKSGLEFELARNNIDI